MVQIIKMKGRGVPETKQVGFLNEVRNLRSYSQVEGKINMLHTSHTQVKILNFGPAQLLSNRIGIVTVQDERERIHLGPVQLEK
jgi:hypothetical protein